MLNDVTLVYYARRGVKAALQECDQVLSAMRDRESRSYRVWSDELEYNERLLEELDRVWEDMKAGSDDWYEVFLGENRET